MNTPRLNLLKRRVGFWSETQRFKEIEAKNRVRIMLLKKPEPKKYSSLRDEVARKLERKLGISRYKRKTH